MDPQLLHAARLTSDVSLAVFRAALAAMSRPGHIEHLPVRRVDGISPDIPAELLVPLALADLEVAVAVLDHDAAGDAAAGVDAGVEAGVGTRRTPAWAEVIRAVTGARLVRDVWSADLVVARRLPTPAEIAALRTGDAATPERGARLVLACASLSARPRRADLDEVGLHLTGPGAAAGRQLWVGGVPPVVFSTLRTRNDRFPAGVDTWLVTSDGAMAAIPRSATIDVGTVAAPVIDEMSVNGVR